MKNLTHKMAQFFSGEDFAENGYVEKWYNLFWFKGHIRCRPYSVYERWLKTHRWHEREDV